MSTLVYLRGGGGAFVLSCQFYRGGKCPGGGGAYVLHSHM